MDELEQERLARESKKQYEAAVSQRADPIGHEIDFIASTYRTLMIMSPAASKRAMAYLNAVMAERLN